jgi:hypothetical protein
MSQFISCNNIKINNSYEYEMYYSLLLSYFVHGSDNDDVSRFPINATLKWGGWYRTICFDQEKVFVLLGNLQKMTVQGRGTSP